MSRGTCSETSWPFLDHCPCCWLTSSSMTSISSSCNFCDVNQQQLQLLWRQTAAVVTFMTSNYTAAVIVVTSISRLVSRKSYLLLIDVIKIVVIEELCQSVQQIVQTKKMSFLDTNILYFVQLFICDEVVWFRMRRYAIIYPATLYWNLQQCRSGV